MRRLIVSLIGLAAIAVVVGARGDDSPDSPTRRLDGSRHLPKLFDFEYYKQTFGKVYKCLSEELMRKRLFFSRALSAFVTGVKYRFRRSDHYNAVNQFSDRTLEERERTRNRVLAMSEKLPTGMEREVSDDAAEVQVKPHRDFERRDFAVGEQEDVEGELAQFLEQHEKLLGSEGGRRKRDTSEVEPIKLRELTLDQLISAPEARAPRKPVRIESNNPYYEQIELPTFGLNDQQEKVEIWDFSKMSLRDLHKELDIAGGSLRELSSWKSSKKAKALPRSFMYVDHRTCMGPPRDQGDCGSCYAFASISIMEWLYCTKTGVKGVEFSEQYMIDCGKGRYKKLLKGCEGAASDFSIVKFMHNFGLELRASIPYKSSEGECPYDENYDLKKTGFIRMEGLNRAIMVSASHVHVHIRQAPIYIGFVTGPDFDDYGGGILGGADCKGEVDHAMVIVGYGVQEGQEFYLVRNSYGPNWGEAGYLKVAKSAAKKCLEKTGLLFGTEDGINFPVKPKVNLEN